MRNDGKIINNRKTTVKIKQNKSGEDDSKL